MPAPAARAVVTAEAEGGGGAGLVESRTREGAREGVLDFFGPKMQGMR